MLSITTNLTQFIRGVESDKKYIKEEAMEILDLTLDRIVIGARRDVNKDTWALHDSIRKTSWDTLFGKTFWRKRVTAGGYSYNKKTGRLVDYAEAQEHGNDAGRLAHPYFWPNVHRELVMLDQRMGDMINNASRKVGLRKD